MKNLSLAILMCFGLTTTSKAQDIEPTINYYPFYGGLQMVELDYLSAFYAKTNRLEQEQPRALHWNQVLGPPPENVYIFRNENGKTVFQYGKAKGRVKLIDVKKSLRKAKPHNHWQHSIGAYLSGSTTTRLFPYYLIGRYDRYNPETKIGLIDSLGNLVLDKNYNMILQGNAFFITRENSEFQIRNQELKLVKTVKASRIQPSYHHPGMIDFEVDDKWGLMAKSGKILIPPKYDMPIGHFTNEGFTIVSKDGLYGLIDRQGKEIIKCKHFRLWQLSEGLIVASNKDNIKAYLDLKGKIIIPFRYSHAFGFKEGIARVSVKKDNYYYFGYIDKAGNEIIPLQYSSATDFENGLAKVRIDFPEDRNEVKVYSSIKELEQANAKGQWVTIDKTGKVVD